MSEPSDHHRKSPRLPGYDYSQSGTYFVTICTAQRQHLFGKISNSEMVYSSIGEIALQCWQAIPQHFPLVELDLFVVMPNHIHGLVFITQDNISNVGTRYISSTPAKTENKSGQRANGVKPQSVGAIVGTYKAAVTRQYKTLSRERLPTIWQTRYHDHIVRSERGLNQLREYILNNPACWSNDVFYG
jgi:putative transposase